MSSSLAISQQGKFEIEEEEKNLLVKENFETGSENGMIMSINSPGTISLNKENKEKESSSSKPEDNERKEAIKYTIKGGDTLSTVASLFGLNTKTLLWANNLNDESIIKPGQTVTIPPKDGVMYDVKVGDTLGEIASTYKTEIEEIAKFNQLDANKIVEGQQLFLPNGELPPPPPPTPEITTRTYASSDNSADVASSVTPKINYSTPKAGCHSFPYGYCTWYVAQKRGCVPWGGDAKHWLANSSAYGYSTGQVPVPGAIMVTRESWWGHVAYVESVSGNNVTISEMNMYGWGKTNYRTLNKDNWVIRGYIY